MESIQGIQSSTPLPPDYFLNRMILSPQNSDVADLNTQILGMMPGEAESFLSVDSVVDEAGVDDGTFWVKHSSRVLANTKPLQFAPWRSSAEGWLSTHPPTKPVSGQRPLQRDTDDLGTDVKTCAGGQTDWWRTRWSTCLDPSDHTFTYRRSNRIRVCVKTTAVPGPPRIRTHNQQSPRTVGETRWY
jgi:hypothetical protein